MALIGNLLKRKQLKRSERKWKLYDEIPECNVEILFAFIDQIDVTAHVNSELFRNGCWVYNNSIYVINLNLNMTEEAVINSIIHETLHVAIRNCLWEGFEFENEVINKWLGNGKLVAGSPNSPISVREWDGGFYY